MSTTTTETPAAEPNTGTQQQEAATGAQGDPAEAPLGTPGLSALRAERERGDRLEAELRELKPLKVQMDALAKAFGAGDAPAEDIVGTLQQQVAAMQRDNLVNNVARRHGITAETDVELLRAAGDEATMARLAERLKASAANTTPATNTPAPDASQGTAPPSQEALQEAQYAAFYPNQK